MKTYTILEDWNERDGKVYYRWKLEGAAKWNEKLTAYKQKPIAMFKTINEHELELLTCNKRPRGIDNKSTD